MKWQRIKALVGKELSRIIKDPGLLFLVVVFPLLITVSMGFTFGGLGGSGDATYSVALVNLDTDSEYPQWAEAFIGNLSLKETLELNQEFTLSEAEASLQAGSLSAIVVIPENFGESIESYWNAPIDSNQWVNTSIALQLDQSSMVVKDIVPPIVQVALTETIYGPETTTINLPVSIGTPNLVEADQRSNFDYFAPGLFAFATIFLIMTVAEGYAKEKETGLYKRVSLTPTTSSEIILALTIANVSLAVVQSIIVFLMAMLIGYSPLITIGSLFIIFLAMVLFSITCVGFGLITGVLSKSSGMATGLSFVFIMPLMFLGTFVAIGEPTIVNKIVPSYYMTDIVKALFLRNNPLTSVSIWGSIGILAAFSVLIFTLAVIIYRKSIRE